MSTETDVSLESKKYRRGQHPNSRNNLVPLEPGNNIPAGMDKNPARYSITSRVKDYLGKPLKPPPPDAPARDVLAYSILEGAILRESTPFREVWDRVDGKIPDAVNTTNIDNRTVNIIVSSDKAKTLTESVGNRLAPLQVDNNPDDTQYIVEGEN